MLILVIDHNYSPGFCLFLWRTGVRGRRSSVHKVYVPAYIAFRFSDCKPTLKQLTMIKNKAGDQIEVLKSVAPFWRIVGALLDFDAGGTQLAFIESQNGQQNSLGCCQAMMVHWLAGNGVRPTTWRKLIEVLRDSEKDWLAEQLQQTLCSD